MSRPLALPLLTALFFLTGCMQTAEPRAAAPALECRLTAEPPLTVGGPVSVRFTLTNKTDAPLWVLRWNTPLERWKGTIFAVTLGGREIPYQGPRVKRGDPGRDEYAEIPVGGTAEATVDLSQVYDFAVPGSYRVKAVQGLVDATADAASLPRPRDLHQAMPLDCPAIVLEVKGLEVKGQTGSLDREERSSLG